MGEDWKIFHEISCAEANDWIQFDMCSKLYPISNYVCYLATDYHQIQDKNTTNYGSTMMMKHHRTFSQWENNQIIIEGYLIYKLYFDNDQRLKFVLESGHADNWTERICQIGELEFHVTANRAPPQPPPPSPSLFVEIIIFGSATTCRFILFILALIFEKFENWGRDKRQRESEIHRASIDINF